MIKNSTSAFAKFSILIAISAFLSTNCFAFEIPTALNFLKPKKSPAKEVRSLLKQHNKAMESHNIENVKAFYTTDYHSADGFNFDDLAEMLEKTYKAYGNIKYKTKINNITAFDNWALVQLSDTSSAKLYPDKNKKNKEKMGKLEGKSVYNVYLKKTKDGWKIVSDEILMEETSLKYGIANKIDMELITPVFVKNGEEYDVSLKMEKPEEIVALASISREEIVYPPSDYQEKFRRIPESGDLERLVRANDKNLDEYAIASIGFTKVSVNEEELRAKIEVLGMAYIMKRINMEKTKGASLKGDKVKL